MSETVEVTLGGPPSTRKTPETTRLDGRFWRIPLGEEDKPPPVHETAAPWAEALWRCWRPLRRRDREHDALYENRELRMIAAGGASPTMRWLESVGFDTSDLFVTTGIVDTFAARMVRRKTMPMFVVDDAEWSLKSQAQEFRRWLHGKLKECDFEEVYSQIVVDMLVRGDGLVYVDEGDDDVFVERVHRREILLDPHEVKMGPGAIRTMFRYRAVSRDSLIDRFPDFRAQIEAAPESTSVAAEWAERGSDLLANEREVGTRDVVDLVEAWHPPAKEPMPGEPCDGRRFVGLGNVTLCYEEWRDTDFPFARFPCFKPQEGYWSTGVVERLRRIQMSINKMVRNLDMNVEVVGRGMWMVPEQFDLPVEKFSSPRPFKLTYKGPRPPEFTAPTAFSSQTFQYLQFKIDQAHNLVGSAQWSAQGRSPLGAGASGVAIDTMEDLLSDRHAIMEDRVSIGRIGVAQCLLSAAGRVAARMEEEDHEVPDDDEPEEVEYAEGESVIRKKQKTKIVKRKKPYYAIVKPDGGSWMDKGVLERLDWHTVSMTRKQYRLQLEPVGFMPSTRAGKLAATNELIKVGAIQQNQATELYDEPDLAHLNRLQLALRHNNERMCEQVGMLTKPMPQPCEYHDLAGLLAMAKQYYNRAENEMDPIKHRTERQRVLLRYMDFCDRIIAVQDLMAKAEAEKAAQMRRDAEAQLPPPGGQMDAGAGPGMPPVGDMGAAPPGMPPTMTPPPAGAPAMA